MASCIYYFLIEVDDPKAGDEDLKFEITGRFDDYAECHCDDNNWRHHLVAVMRGGRLLAGLNLFEERNE